MSRISRTARSTRQCPRPWWLLSPFRQLLGGFAGRSFLFDPWRLEQELPSEEDHDRKDDGEDKIALVH